MENTPQFNYLEEKVHRLGGRSNGIDNNGKWHFELNKNYPSTPEEADRILNEIRKNKALDYDNIL